MTGKPSVTKEPVYLGVPWEEAYGYAQAIKIGRTIYLSGQFGHDEHGHLQGPATLDARGRITDSSGMALQMRTAYENAKRVLAKYGAGLDNVVEETLYVTDFEAAFSVAGKIRKAVYETDRPKCASTILGATRLAFPQQLIEISFVAVLLE